jgi:hypothetical protein
MPHSLSNAGRGRRGECASRLTGRPGGAPRIAEARDRRSPRQSAPTHTATRFSRACSRSGRRALRGASRDRQRRDEARERGRLRAETRRPVGTAASCDGTAGLVGPRTSDGQLPLILEVNTVFASAEDEQPDAQQVVTVGRIAFAGEIELASLVVVSATQRSIELEPESTI